ncbi:MAG: recombination-associated protein RdgC, partial [Deltaproteobacteria bacterium]|nr:recombination-associated protein RdgC [Deltaproteobacteria bacterium]
FYSLKRRSNMGLINGSCSLTRFIVEDPLPENYLETFPPLIQRYAFRGFDESSEVERSIGWVNIMDMFDSHFNRMQYLKEPYLALTWRIDVRNVPNKALKQYSLEAERKVMEMEDLEFLPKGKRKEIKEMTRASLLKRAIPSSRIYDTVWNLDKGYVLFGGATRKLCDEFSTFFHKCFNIRLGSVYPYLTASGFLEQEGQRPEQLDELTYSITGVNN